MNTGELVNLYNDYYKQLLEEITFDAAMDGKRMLNYEINKLYKSTKYLKSKQHFEETVIKCYVIIEKLIAMKSDWPSAELWEMLDNGISYYQSGFDNSVSEFYRKAPKKKSPDGHILRSNAELIIDLWLNYHAIKHEYEPRISVSKGEYIVPDFYLPEFDCYLEYWGLDGDTDYEKRKQNKIQTYQTLKLRLVSVYQEDLDNLDSLLKEITLNHSPKVC
jgi:hypothetical protein